MVSAELRRPAAPARLPLSARVRLAAALTVGNAAALASRAAGKGSGASIRGQILTRLAPDAFALLVQGRRIAAVSGTNGKTTTTHLLAAAVRDALGSQASRLVTNTDGANLHYGIASALAAAGRADVAVLETDERVVADLVAHGRPEILILLNFSRDQMDRHHEIKSLGRSWRQALERAGADGPTVIANADDPLVVWAAEKAARVVWVDTATKWNADSALCPSCGALLTHTAAGRAVPTGAEGADSRWDCPNCSLTQPEATYRVDGTAVVLPDGRRLETDLQVPGSFNVSNAACALAAAAVWGIDAADALPAMRTVTAPAGRFATGHFGATSARLLLAKNPAGWTEALPLLGTDPAILAIDSVAADGKDVSWLWDVDFEQLAGRHIVCTGPRAYDLAVRLHHAEVSHEVLVELDDALERVKGPEVVDCIATYTPFQELLKKAGLR